MSDTTLDAPAVTTLRNHVAGQWVEVDAVETLVDRDPATGEHIANVPLSGAAAVATAAAAAKAAQREWRELPPQVRARHLMALREVLDAHREELARLVTRDMGKTLPDALGEVGRGIESVEAAIGIPHLLKGENLEGVAKGVDVEMVRQPVGVVGAITPFNFPAMIPLWFLPFAVACGNTFVLKPSEQDPLPSVRMFELIEEHEIFPPGVVNLVHGGRDAVNALIDCDDIDAISFVGSANTARYVASRAAEQGKRAQALGGAKNAMVAMPDADPKVLAAGVTSSAFGAAGQRCLAGSLLVLVGDEAEQDAQPRDRGRGEPRARRRRRLRGGRPTSARWSRPRRASASSARSTAPSPKAPRPCSTAASRSRGPGGAALGPTILDRVGPDAPAAREELFGPVLTVLRAPDLGTAIERVNGSRYGNASVIFTTSGGAAREYRRGVEAGMIGVNIGVAAPIAWFPFSGWKDSIDGDLHANGTDAVDFYTRKKVLTSRW